MYLWHKEANSSCGPPLGEKKNYYLNILKHKTFQSRTLFLKDCPDPDPEQKAKLVVAYSGDANLSRPLLCGTYTALASGVLTK